MAKPQKENGYTPIANEILEQIIRFPLNGTQFRILMVVWRYTYGFSRKEHELSESFISKSTGISKRFVNSEINKLIKSNILIIIQPSTFTSPRKLGFNKDYECWNTRTRLQQVNDTSTGEQEFTSTGEGYFTSTGERSFHQENNNKTNIKSSSKQNPFTYYEQNIAPLVLTSQEIISEWMGEYPHELICKAIDIAVKSNKRHLNYIEGILRNWKSKNITTLEAVEGSMKKFEIKKNGTDSKVVDLYDW